jgi:hypothetical protein
MVINDEMERKQKGRSCVFQALKKKTHTQLRTHYLPTLNHNNATIRKESKVTQAVLNIKSMSPEQDNFAINHQSQLADIAALNYNNQMTCHLTQNR